MIYRYYCTQRPIAPGAIPRSPRNVRHFAGRVNVSSIGRKAYGYAEYNRKLTADEVETYELVEEVLR